MRRRQHLTGIRLALAVVGMSLLASCSAGTKGASTTSSTTSPTPISPVLTILVTNDDGVAAPGIDAVVQGLRILPHTQVTVVAPATDESGTGGKTTPGTITATKSKTASGYPAWAVNGFPADTITWAIAQHGIPLHPDLVVSGINFGQNIGPLASGSGTVGAAQAAVSHGIPALAVSQGVDDGMAPDFAEGVTQVDGWIALHRSALVDRSYGKVLPQGNMNVPTCPGGHVRGPVNAPLATSTTGLNITTVDCTSTSTSYTNDVQAFLLGYAVIAPLSTKS